MNIYRFKDVALYINILESCFRLKSLYNKSIGLGVLCRRLEDVRHEL